MFGVPVPPVLAAFTAFLSEPEAIGATALRPVEGGLPVWVPPEVRAFAIAPDGSVVGVVVAHPERPIPDWPIVRYTRAHGAQILGLTARQGLTRALEDHAADTPDEIAQSLLAVRLAVAPDPEVGWPSLDGLARVQLPDGIGLVVPRDTVDPADFSPPRSRSGDALIPWIRSIGDRRPGSALALGRSAAFEAFRSGQEALALALVAAVGPSYRALGRTTYADEVTPGERTTPG